jgi:hypothetical protein
MRRRWYTRTSKEATIVTVAFIALLVLLSIFLIATERAEAQTPADVAECVAIPYSNRIIGNCPHETPRYYMGCRQDLARLDPGDNWYSPDFPKSGAAMEQHGMCDVPTKRAFRGCYRVEFTGGEHWIVFRQSVYPRTAARLLAPMDPGAAPPDTNASSYYVMQWHCNDENTGQPIEGPYARQFDYGQAAWNGELDVLANWDFLTPEYFEAYEAVRFGYFEVAGASGNPHEPGTIASTRHAMEKRSAVFALAAYGLPGREHGTIRGFEVLHQVAEYYIVRHCDYDEIRLANVFPSWSGPESREMDACIDNLFELTNSIRGDPWWIYTDIDVSVGETSHGLLKHGARDGTLFDE